MANVKDNENNVPPTDMEEFIAWLNNHDVLQLLRENKVSIFEAVKAIPQIYGILTDEMDSYRQDTQALSIFIDAKLRKVTHKLVTDYPNLDSAIIDLLRMEGDNLEFLPLSMRDDKLLVSCAVNNDGSAYLFASSRLQDDPDIIKQSIENYRGSTAKPLLAYAPKRWQNDRELIKLSLTKDLNDSRLRSLMKGFDFSDDDALMSVALEADPDYVWKASKKLQRDPKFLAKTMKHHDYIAELLIKGDKDIVYGKEFLQEVVQYNFTSLFGMLGSPSEMMSALKKALKDYSEEKLLKLAMLIPQHWNVFSSTHGRTPNQIRMITTELFSELSFNGWMTLHKEFNRGKTNIGYYDFSYESQWSKENAELAKFKRNVDTIELTPTVLHKANTISKTRKQLSKNKTGKFA